MGRGYMGLGLLWAFLHGLGLALMMGKLVVVITCPAFHTQPNRGPICFRRSGDSLKKKASLLGQLINYFKNPTCLTHHILLKVEMGG